MRNSVTTANSSIAYPPSKHSRAFENVPEERRRIMSAIGSRNTAPEILVRSILHQMGYRFTIAGPMNKSLPGSPDIVLPGRKTVVFVHGCFWHGHATCGKSRPTKTRRAFWKRKIHRNRERDAQHNHALKKMHWKVIIVWECELRPSKQKRLQAKFKRSIPNLAAIEQ